MPTRTVRRLTTMTLALAATLTWVPAAHAAGAVNIDSCQTLSTANTVYKLTADLTSCGTCLVVANDRITIDLQGHSISSTCPGKAGSGSAISAGDGVTTPRDLVVIRNGTVSGYSDGVFLPFSTRVSVLGIKATDNFTTGIHAGAQSLVKSSEASGNEAGIQVGDRGQVQQSSAHNNRLYGIFADGDKCLITMNTANFNGFAGILAFGNRCTESFNTANNNTQNGILTTGSANLVTGNVALNNTSGIDYLVQCPSTVTNNDSTNGFPTFYDLIGTGCHTANND
jgi:hypothetical protein